MTTPRPQKPFLSTTAILLKVFAAGNLNLDEVKTIFASISPNIPNVKASDAILHAEAGKIRSATKQSNQALLHDQEKASVLMSNLAAPPETTKKITASEREQLKGIHDRNKSTQMGFEQQLQEIENQRREILNAIEKITAIPANGTARPSISSTELEQLKAKTKKYFIEVTALREKVVEFVNKTKKEADVIMPNIPTERVQTKQPTSPST